MELVLAYKGHDTDGEFQFAELIFELDGERISAIGIEANELRLLVASQASMEEIVDEMDFEGGAAFETETTDDEGNKTKAAQEIDIEALIEYFMESDMEHYMCWKADLGEEGLGEAQESEVAIPLLTAYEYLRGASLDRVSALLEAVREDAFFEAFDGSEW